MVKKMSKSAIKKLISKRDKLIKELDKIESQIYILDDKIAYGISALYPENHEFRQIRRHYERSVNFSGYED